MNEEIITVELNGALCARIEEFLQQHGLDESLEDFVVNAGRARLEQLASRQEARQPLRAQAKDEEYSDDAVERAWGAANKPLTSHEKTRLLKDLAAEYRRLKYEYNLGRRRPRGI